MFSGVIDPLIFIFGYKNMRAYLRGKKFYRDHRRSQLSGYDHRFELRDSCRVSLRGRGFGADVCSEQRKGGTERTWGRRSERKYCRVVS
jgi:hypothetical protein